MADHASDLTRKPIGVPFNGDVNAFPSWVKKFKSLAANMGIPAGELDQRLPTLNAAKSEKLYQLLTTSLEGKSDVVLDAVAYGNGNGAWQALMNEYAPTSAANTLRIMGLVTALSLKGDDPESVMELCHEANNLVRQIRMSGNNVSDIENAARGQVCRQLPAIYAVVVARNAADNPSWSDIHQQIRGIATSLAIPARPGAAGGARAANVAEGLEVNTDGAGAEPERQANLAPSRRGRGGRGGLRGRASHFSGGRSGGFPGFQGGRRGRHEQGGRQRRPIQGNCYLCNQPGHGFLACPSAPRLLPHLRGRGNMQANMLQAGYMPGELEEYTVMSAVLTSPSALERQTLDHGVVQLCIDTGANTCILGDPRLFSEMRQEKGQSVRLADGNSVSVCGIGTSLLTARDSTGAPVTLQLKDVCYIPGAKNILSLSRLLRLGHQIDFTNHRITLDTGTILPFTQAGGLFYLGAKVKSNLRADQGRQLLAQHHGSDVLVVASAVQPGDPWSDLKKLTPMQRHIRMGHAHEESLRLLGIIGAKETIGFCHTCAESKSRAMSISRNPAPLRGVAIGQWQHADILGPVTPLSFGGNKFALVIQDDKSHYNRVYLMREKSEALSKVQEHYNFLRAAGIDLQPGQCTLFTDQDSVFKAQDFRNWCEQQAIVQSFSPVYLPQLNGRIERQIGVLQDMARAMMIGKGLSSEYWAFSLQFASLQRNLQPCASIDNAVPYELFFGRSAQDLRARLRVFGSKAWVHLPDTDRTKFSAKARPGVYVGMSLNSRGHVIFYPDSKRTTDTLNCTIDEFGNGEQSSDTVQRAVVPARDVVVERGAPTNAVDTVTDEGRKGDSERLIFTPATSVTASSTPPTSAVRAGDEQSESPAKFPRSDVIGTPVVAGETAWESTLQAAMVNAAMTDEPRTVHDIAGRTDAAEWLEAIEKECQAMLEMGALQYVDQKMVPKDAEPIKSMLIFKLKVDKNGKETRKARLVAKGCAQAKSTYDSSLTYSPVLSFVSLRVMLSLVASQGLHLFQMDISNAFLQSDPLEQDLYLMQPDGWPQTLGGVAGSKQVMKMKIPIYGTRQANRSFFETMSGFLRTLGFRQTDSDPCLFVKASHGVATMYLSLFVDDVLLGADSVEAASEVKAALMKRFVLKDLGRASKCIGWEISVSPDGVRVHQEEYIKKLLLKNNMADCKPADTPATTAVNLDDSSSKLLPPDQASKYYENVGGLNYLANGCRSDLCAVASRLSRYVSAPRECHQSVLKRTLRYLQGSKTMGLYFRGGSATGNNTLMGYADASFNSEADSRSVSGYVFLLNNAAVSWRSKVQTMVTMSTAESEFEALRSATQECLYLRNLLQELLVPQQGATVLNEDNVPTIQAINASVCSARNKHYALRLNFVRYHVQLKTIEIKYCESSLNAGDFYTKFLAAPQFRKLRNIVCGMIS